MSNAGTILITGANVKYVAVPHDAARQSMMGMGIPEWIADGYAELSAGFANLHEVLREATRTTVESLGAAATGLFLFDPGTDTLSLAAENGLPDPLKARFASFPVAGFHNESVVREGRPKMHGSPAEIPEFRALGLPAIVPGWGTYLCVPLTAKGKVQGVLGVFSQRPQTFDRYDVALFQAIGEQIGLAIVNARLHESVQQMAITDRVTGAHNRHYLDLFLEGELWRYAEEQRGVALVMMDMDDFKTYNDAHGHLAGDAVLREVTQVLRATLRPGDLVARYGGEEFALLLRDIGAVEAVRLAEEIRSAIERHAFPHGRLTASIGLAYCGPMTAHPPDQMISMADQALYEAKRSGGNQVRAWVDDPATTTGRREPAHTAS